LKNTSTSRNFVDQLPKNIFANIIYFFVNVFIGIILVPYFVSTLGVATYGLIPLATSIIGYVAIVVQSLNTVVSRFLTVDLQKGDYVAANRTFNTALLVLTMIIILMVPVLLAVAWFIPSFFNVPTGQESNATLLFLGVCAAFLIRSWAGNFTVQLFAYNRLDLQNLVNLANLLIQTGLIILLFKIFGPSLSIVGGAYFAGAVAASMISIILAQRVCPYLGVSIHLFDPKRVKDISEMGWWVVINNIGALLFNSIDLIIVNLIFGASSAGKYAIVLQWVILLRGVAGMLSNNLTPTIFSYYARGETETMIQIVKSAMKLMGLAMALPIGLVCGFAPQILTIWVGLEYTTLAPLMVLVTIHLIINLTVMPLFSINVAYNKVRVPGVVTLIMGAGNIIFAVTLAYSTDWGYYSVALAGAIILTLKNALFTPWYATRILGTSMHTFIRPILSGVIATLLLWAVGTALGSLCSLTMLIPLIASWSILAIIYIKFVWRFSLSTFERKIFSLYLTNILNWRYIL